MDSSNPFDIQHEDGWVGAFSRQQAQGAMPNGTPIQKVLSEPGDDHSNGATGVVLGSLAGPGMVIMYFVEWSDAPRVARATLGWKIDRLSM